MVSGSTLALIVMRKMKMATNNYWAERMANAQNTLTERNRKDIDKQIRKYYQSISKQIIEDFENTFNKLLVDMEKVATGERTAITVADLYKLDKYWEMQKQVQSKLTKLGNKQIAALTKAFKTEYWEIYRYFSLEGVKAFSTIDDVAVKQVINQIWCSDGKSWSQRVWENTSYLQQTLNDELIHCVVSGKDSSYLKKLLMERFSVSYNNADMLVRTELAHIQTQAAQQRYKDYGIAKMEVWVDEDERTCPVCSKHEGEVYSVNSKMPVPFHPRCRCCLIPIIDIPKINTF